MATFVKKDAILLCTGCPGVPGRLDAQKARTVNLENGTIGVEDDKTIAQPAFGTCLIIPTAPRKCNPQLGAWMNTKSDVKSKGKSLILFPNTIPCSFGPGLLTMTFPGQVRAAERANPAQGGNKHCNWTTCDDKHEFDITYPNDGVVERKQLKGWAHPSTLIGLGHVPPFQAKLVTSKDIAQASSYPFQMHHVIPCAVFKARPNIRSNLKQLGFDINNEGLNGISLPQNPEDIKWHAIQAHRGSHPVYNTQVEAYLASLEGKVVNFCKEDKQGELWEKIEAAVKHFREEILTMGVTLRGGAVSEMAAAAKEAAQSHL